MAWTFIYVAYSYTESKAYAYAYFAKSDSYGSAQWMNIEKRTNPPELNFRLGGCNPTKR
jgi:hypothetical protein